MSDGPRPGPAPHAHPPRAAGPPRAPSPGDARQHGIVVAAGAAAAVWVVAMLVVGIRATLTDPPERLAGGLLVALLLAMTLLPAVTLGLAVLSLRLRDDLRRIEARLAALGESPPATRTSADDEALRDIERRLDELARTWARPPVARPHPPPRPAHPAGTAESAQAALPGADAQPTLALDEAGGVSAQPPCVEDLLIALNFPENADDTEGFRALRRVLRDRASALLVQASQDILTLLSQDGIYMDDMRPGRPRPDEWRRFARGERGHPVAALGAIHDHAALARAAGRMRSDTIFRDAAHHFLRRFDQMLGGFEKGASDDELAALAETRTARAFMLLGRVAGIFD